MKKIIFIFVGLYSVNAFAYYTENILNQCGVMGNKLNAVFTINQYTCNSGEFLPAYSLGCESCPDDFTCSGGIYTFNDNKYQGAIKSSTYITHNMTNMCAENAYHDLVAVFTPNIHTCSAGYYLPAGIDRCVKCLNDSYCPGGTYTFNETMPQGIVSCASGLYAPTGMWESAQCGRILHIGDNVVYLRSVKKTTPALHIDIDNDGVADFFGNITTADVPMHIGTDRKLKLQYNGITYSVYDDTVNVVE